MSNESTINRGTPAGIDAIDFNGAGHRSSGKVRENFSFADGRMAIVVTDRVSVFDYNIGTIPFKGQILNELSAWWFRKLDEINVPHHFLSVPHPNISLVRKAAPLKIEMVIRGYLTGTTTTSSWYAYRNHNREICGFQMPAGMQKNEAFPVPICTPTTKASIAHDANISRADIIARDLATPAIYDAAEDLAFRMFTYGQAVARERGLILVDTKYEMGLTESGDLIVIDEVHTPDSSRYWIADSYASRMASGSEPESLDKEFVRRMIINEGYDVDSAVDPRQFFADKVRLEAADKYADLYAKITGDGVVKRYTNVGEIESALGLIARSGDF